jgi:inosose dehydratase
MQQLKFAYQTLCWLNYPEKHYGVEDVVREVKEAGFSGIEFAEQIQHFGRVPDFAEFMEREGMQMASLSSGISYTPNDPLEQTIKRAEFAAGFGVKALMLCGGWGPEASTKSQKLYASLAANVDRLAENLEQHNMKPAFHPHLQTLVETAEDVERLLDMSAKCSLCLDIAHFDVAGGDPVRFFRAQHDRVSMVHLKDWVDDPTTEVCGRKGRFCELGEGRVNVAGFLDVAREMEFDGWLVIELDSTTRTPLESAMVSHEFLVSKGYLLE